jgi:dihydroorotate dehydrogenase (fumarate)
MNGVDLTTTFAGVRLKNPILIGACGKTQEAASIEELAGSGVGGIVMKTLFQHGKPPGTSVRFAWRRSGTVAHRAHSLHSVEPGLHELEAYVRELRRARSRTSIPAFASISCVDLDAWPEYAVACAEAGATAVELNLGCPLPHGGCGTVSEPDEVACIVEAVKAAVGVPVTAKLGAQTASPTALAGAAAAAGADGVVLLNKFAGLDVDLDLETPILHAGYTAITGPWFADIVRRWVAETYKRVRVDVAATGGVWSGADVIKHLLAGACCIQMVAIVYDRGPYVIEPMLEEIRDWMALKGHPNIAAFRGKTATALKGPHAQTGTAMPPDEDAQRARGRIGLGSVLDSG